jgi:serine/threonine protein kinase
VVDIPPDTGLVRQGTALEIADYDLKTLIGAGSFGSVFSACHQKTNEHFAIKIIDLDKQLRLADVIALEQEIRAMKVLAHPNLVRLNDVIRGRRHIW